MSALSFTLPKDLEASDPPAVRDQVRMMVADGDTISHARFLDLPKFLRAGIGYQNFALWDLDHQLSLQLLLAPDKPSAVAVVSAG